MDMITEDYISFNTAKLLKEKGFDGICGTAYETITNEHEVEQCSISEWGKLGQVKRPTLQMAMKWLREVHKIEIRVIYDNDKLCWYGACNPMNEPSQILLGSGRKCKSYEEACESATRYCLENLI